MVGDVVGDDDGCAEFGTSVGGKLVGAVVGSDFAGVSVGGGEIVGSPLPPPPPPP